MPIRTDENSASTTLIAKIGACRKFDNRTPNNGSYLFRKSPLNHSSSLKPFVKPTTRRKGGRNRNRLGLIPATDISTTTESKYKMGRTINPPTDPSFRSPFLRETEDNPLPQ